MKKLLVFVGLVVFVGVLWADNLIFNSGFDETPWDTGWTIYNISAWADANGDPRHQSAPRSCRVWSNSVYGSAPYVEVSQVVQQTVNCTCKVYYQYFVSLKGKSGAWATIRIYVRAKNQWGIFYWKEEWNKTFSVGQNSDSSWEVSTWTEWEKVYSDPDTISGIMFYAASFHEGMEALAQFWVDDVYISETAGVEESEKFKVKSVKLSAYPNPFRQSTSIRFQIQELKEQEARIEISDLAGRVVRSFLITNPSSPITTVVWDREDNNGNYVPQGAYFCVLDAGEPKRVHKLIVMK